MSSIIALKDKKMVHVIADTQTTTRINKKNHLEDSNLKIFKAEGINDCLIGKVGYVKEKSVLSNVDFGLKHLDDVTFNDVVRIILPKMLEALESQNRTKNTENETLGTTIIVLKEKIYQIDYTMAVSEINDYVAIGSGLEIVNGVLKSNKNKNSKERIIEAIEAVSKFNNGVSAPFIYYNTEKMKMEIIGEEKENVNDNSDKI